METFIGKLEIRYTECHLVNGVLANQSTNLIIKWIIRAEGFLVKGASCYWGGDLCKVGIFKFGIHKIKHKNASKQSLILNWDFPAGKRIWIEIGSVDHSLITRLSDCQKDSNRSLKSFQWNGWLLDCSNDIELILCWINIVDIMNTIESIVLIKPVDSRGLKATSRFKKVS